MQHKIKAKLIIVMLMSMMMAACVSTRNTAELTKDKEAELYLKMGVRYLEMNMLKIAKEKLEYAVELDSSNVEIRNALGALYERLQMFDHAKANYLKALSFNSDNVSIKNNYGRFLCARGEYQAGIDLLNEALKMPLNNRRWFAYNHIGHCEILKGDEQTAESYFRQALLENRQYSPALLELQKISYKKGSFMSARAFLQRFLGISKHTSETLWYAVQTERSLGNQALSENYRQMLFNQFPASKEAQQLKTAIQ